MAENDQSQQDRTEQPTQKRQQDAKKKGQVARSRELSMMLVTLTGAISCVVLQPYFSDGLTALVADGLSHEYAKGPDSIDLVAALWDGLFDGVGLLLPLFGVLVVAAVLGNTVLGGLVFSFEALKPNLSKLNPISGLKRVFGMNGLMELLKALAKFALVAMVAAILFTVLGDRFFALGRMPIDPALGATAKLVGQCAVALAATLILIALADVPFQIWQHNKKMRMTKQELKDEQKETEGRPEVKSKLRALQQEAANRRMMEAVPSADVVTTNPNHFAVALKYEAGKMSAPTVVAKGADLIAQRIKKVALDNDVPVFEHPPLARALYYTTEIGREIPQRLYAAVAQVLTYVYQLRNAAQQSPVGPPSIEVDRDLTLSPAARLAARRDQA